jgi:membrane protein DedA with SNARE-associated domain
VRAPRPPFAGALRLGAVRSGVAMGLASAVWYGVITYLAYTAGANFEALQARIATGPALGRRGRARHRRRGGRRRAAAPPARAARGG